MSKNKNEVYTVYDYIKEHQNKVDSFFNWVNLFDSPHGMDETNKIFEKLVEHRDHILTMLMFYSYSPDDFTNCVIGVCQHKGEVVNQLLYISDRWHSCERLSWLMRTIAEIEAGYYK